MAPHVRSIYKTEYNKTISWKIIPLFHLPFDCIYDYPSLPLQTSSYHHNQHCIQATETEEPKATQPTNAERSNH
jgi:hypothetical protein